LDYVSPEKYVKIIVTKAIYFREESAHDDTKVDETINELFHK